MNYKPDHLVRALLITLGATAFAVSVGVEIRALLVARHWPAAVGVSAAFLVLVLTFRWSLVRVNAQRIASRGTQQWYKFQKASSTAEARARLRFEACGISVPVDILTVPATWNLLDAFVLPKRRGRARLVLCGGAQALAHLAPRRFDTLIDHEIGHIVNNDAGLFATAKALLIASGMIATLKLVMLFAFPSIGLLDLYSGLFPPAARLTDAGISILNEEQGFSNEFLLMAASVTPSRSAVLLVVLSLIIFGITVAVATSWAMVRTREYWADQFAMIQATDRQERLNEFASLLKGVRRRGRWHPPSAARIDAITQGHHPQSVRILWGSALMFGTLLGYRLIFSDAGNTMHMPIGVTYAMSFAVFCGMFYYLVAEFGPRNQSVKITAALRSLLLLSAATAVISLIVVMTFWQMQRGISEDSTVALGVQLSNDAQTFDLVALVLSAPFFVLSGGGSLLLCCRSTLKAPHREWTAVLAATGLTLALMYLGGYPLQKAISRYRNSELIVLQDQILHNRSLERDRGEDIASLVKGLSDTNKVGAAILRSASDYAAYCSLRRKISTHLFQPPLALFALWQNPLRVEANLPGLKNQRFNLLLFLRAGDISNRGSLTRAEFLTHAHAVDTLDCDALGDWWPVDT